VRRWIGLSPLIAVFEKEFSTFPPDPRFQDVDGIGKMVGRELISLPSNFHKFSTGSLWTKKRLIS
jgi:hypothetical protein